MATLSHELYEPLDLPGLADLFVGLREKRGQPDAILQRWCCPPADHPHSIHHACPMRCGVTHHVRLGGFFYLNRGVWFVLGSSRWHEISHY